MNAKPRYRETPEAIPAPLPAAATINGPLGGQVGLWHEQLDRAFREEAAADPLELTVSTLSRWAGPAIFLAAISGLVYILS